MHKLPACFTFSDGMTGEIICDLSKISQGAARAGAQSRFGVPVDVAERMVWSRQDTTLRIADFCAAMMESPILSLKRSVKRLIPSI